MTTVVLLVLAVPATAQWPPLVDPALPRRVDGSVDLLAPAPRTADGRPDLGGVWRRGTRRDVGGDIDVPLQPWAAMLYRERTDSFGKGTPPERCLPGGVPDAMMVSGLPWRIVQTPRLTVMLLEQFTQYRQIMTDGRALPTGAIPTWFGYSVGRWEGETFVVSSSGFNDKTWINESGLPHTEALKLTERYRRLSVGQLEVEFSFDDPGAFTRPWSDTIMFTLMPDAELIEHVCENEKFSSRGVGK